MTKIHELPSAGPLQGGDYLVISQGGRTRKVPASALQSASAAVTSVAGRTGAVTLTSADVGLSNVDNTSDADKPVSTATQTALNNKSDTGHTHGAATTSVAGFMSATDKAKLDGVAAGATANSTDAQLRDRSTHTGTQPIASIEGLQSALEANGNATASYVDVSTNAVASLFSGHRLTASLDLTLPANPGDGAWVEIVNHSGTTTGRVLRNGQNINGLAEDMYLDVRWIPFRLVYRQGYGWFLG